jgi:hypothetical protein
VRLLELQQQQDQQTTTVLVTEQEAEPTAERKI